MLAELVRVTTPDGVRLDGALVDPRALVAAGAAQAGEAEAAGARFPLDVAIMLHGAGANFYGSSLLEAVAAELRAASVPTLMCNTRGHDIIYTASTTSGPRLLGAAYESVADCTLDIRAWIELAHSRGWRRIGLFGHSLGAIKAIYALVHDNWTENDIFVCAISPARLSYQRFMAGEQAETFRQHLAEAEQRMADGRPDSLMQVTFPISYVVTAAGYLDKYGPAERYDIVQLLPRIPCPTMVTFGGQEVQQSAAFRGLPEEVERIAADNPRVRLAVISGADHVYSGARAELNHRLAPWLKSLS